MITYLLGLPGSGKSYFAVDRIFNNFSKDEEAKKDKKVTFKNCYTNINEFQFDKIENVYNLDFEVLHKILTRLHTHYKAKKTDKYLVKYLSRIKLKDTLFVIDEAHNYFDSKDRVLVWWLSYHRHLFHEIILITQNLGLIESKYKAFSEFFYVAKPQSLTLFKSHFKYNIFCSSRLSKNSHSGNIKIKRSKKVFDLYHSGDSINTSNVIMKFLLIGLSIFIVLMSFVWFFVLKNDVPNIDDSLPGIDKNITTNNYSNSPGEKIINEDDQMNIDNSDYEDLMFLRLNCSTSSCSYLDFSLPPQIIGLYIKSHKFDLIYKESKSKNNTFFYVSCDSNFYRFLFPLKKEFKEDEENNNLSIFNTESVGK